MSLPVFGCRKGKFTGVMSGKACEDCMDYEGSPRGLGDSLASIISTVTRGHKPKKCGCGKRRAKLNRMISYGSHANR